MTGTSRFDGGERVVLGLLLLAFALILVRSAWLCDDAFITFRSVDNFVSGYGLRFNVAERVQAYTHPLWMLLLTATAGATGNFDEVPLLLSLALSITAVFVLALRIADTASAAIVATAILAGSRAFVDYSTSGLENPLSHLLLVCFALAYFDRDREPSRRDATTRLLLCSGIAGLAMLCRMDTALVYGPPLLALMLERRSLGRAGWALLALSPFLLWEAFSFFYYGSLVPNTAYAKLGAGLPTSVLVGQGLAYLRASLEMDPITLVAIAAGCALGFVRREREGPFALGIVALLFYGVAIGGDFMVGRHLSLPLLAAVVVIARSLPRTRRVAVASMLAVLLLGAVGERPTPLGDAWILRGETPFERQGIVDERSVYAAYTAPWNGWERREHPWTEQGRAAAKRGQAVVPRAAIGLFAFAAGPQVHVVDSNALSDPLLARLPARERGSTGWRIGHHTRDIPAGYLETLRSGENVIEEPAIADLYERVAFVTRAELFSWERLRAALRLALRSPERDTTN